MSWHQKAPCKLPEEGGWILNLELPKSSTGLHCQVWVPWHIHLQGCHSLEAGSGSVGHAVPMPERACSLHGGPRSTLTHSRRTRCVYHSTRTWNYTGTLRACQQDKATSHLLPISSRKPTWVPQGHSVGRSEWLVSDRCPPLWSHRREDRGKGFKSSVRVLQVFLSL